MGAGSTFAERFAFARDHQAMGGMRENNGEFAKGIGVSAGLITEYLQRDDAPPSDRVLAIAVRCGVDPGWLEFGALTKAPEPDKFQEWLRKTREKKHAAIVKTVEDDFPIRQPSKRTRQMGKRRR